MSTRTVYQPTAAMLQDSQVVPFVDDEHCDASERALPDFADRMERRRARWNAAEAVRVAPILERIAQIRAHGRVETFGHPTGYAYRVGQAARRAA